MESSRRLRLPRRRAYAPAGAPQRPADGAAGFFAELRRRKVFRAGAAYLVVAWVAVQAMSIALPAFEAPAWTLRVIILLALLGFPVTLVLAWMLDTTPAGLRFDPALSGNKRVFASAGVLALLALAWFFLGQPSLRRDAAATHSTPGNARPAPAIPDKSIAVLSFENLSGDPRNAYFVSGMQDLILTNLARIRDLKVISRTSTDKYASHPENLRTVAAELGVATVLEGSVQRAGERVLINLQLIDARTDTHLWAETYDRTVEDVFAVEQEIATTVADALHATLSQGEAAAIAERPTRDPDAYDLFLRAEYLIGQDQKVPTTDVVRQAIALYRKAVARDPAFALAHANLSYALSRMYWLGGTPTEPAARFVAEARREMAEARRLQPKLPEANLAEAYVLYWIDQDFAAAAEAFERALAARPGDARALKGKGLVLRRLGRLQEAIAAEEASVTLSPRDSALWLDLATTRWAVRQAAQAEADYRHALAIDPDNASARGSVVLLRMYRDGDADGALALLKGVDPLSSMMRVNALRFERRYDASIAALEAVPDEVVLDLTDQPKAYFLGILHWMAGDEAKATPLLREARTVLEARLRDMPPNYAAGQNLRLSLADIEAMLGNEDAALAQVHRALALLPVEKDMLNGPIVLGGAAQVYARLGRADLAVPALARLRQLPAGDQQTSAKTLELDPFWDPIRGDPGFQAEVKRLAALEAKIERR